MTQYYELAGLLHVVGTYTYFIRQLLHYTTS